MSKDGLQALITAWGFAIAVSTAVTAGLDTVLAPDFTLGRRYFLVFAFVVFLIFVGQLLHNRLAPEQSRMVEPKVVKYIPTDQLPEGGFVVKPSEWLSQNLSYAIVFEEEGGYERLLGAAKYVMSQNNGLVQLMVLIRHAGGAEIWKRLDAGETDQLPKIRVKIGMPTDVE